MPFLLSLGALRCGHCERGLRDFGHFLGQLTRRGRDFGLHPTWKALRPKPQAFSRPVRDLRQIRGPGFSDDVSVWSDSETSDAGNAAGQDRFARREARSATFALAPAQPVFLKGTSGG